MPAKNLIFEKKVQKQLLKIPLPVHRRVITALRSIQTNPVSGIKLHGELKDYYKFRVIVYP